MATDLENLKAAKSNILALFATGVKPDYSIDGQSVSWSSLWDRLEKINSLIQAEEPYTFENRGFS